MPVTNYTTLDGEILHENRGGVERDYVPDPLGSTVALLDSTQTKTDTSVHTNIGKTSIATRITSLRAAGLPRLLRNFCPIPVLLVGALLAGGCGHRSDAKLAVSGLDSRHEIWLIHTRGSGPPVALSSLVLMDTDRRSNTDLTSIHQLCGKVQLSTPEQALDFVRLRTSLATWHLWGPNHEAEVIPISKASGIPRYGLTEGFAAVASGCLGVLPDASFRQGGFYDPIVERRAGGFDITRWVYTDTGQVVLIKEHVTTDGAYTRSVKRSIAAPDLTGVTWEFPGFG